MDTPIGPLRITPASFPMSSDPVSQKSLFLYHAQCADGFGSAFAAWLHDPEGFEFVPVMHNQPPPNVRGRKVVMADFCYPAGELALMVLSAAEVTVIDHHKTCEAYLPYFLSEGWVRGVFDKSRSGALLTWDYFHGKPAPWLIEAISDRDIWSWKNPGSKPILAALDLLPFNFTIWKDFLEKGAAQALHDGAPVQRGFEKSLADSMEWGAGVAAHIDGQWVPAINLPAIYASDAGNLLSEGVPFAVVYHDTRRGRKFSLRSRPEGADVASIAESFGGGGHQNAASFVLPWGKEDQVPLRAAAASLERAAVVAA